MVEICLFWKPMNCSIFYVGIDKLGIDMSASFQEAQFQANTIEESILYVDNVHQMEFISAWEQDSQVSPDDSLEDSNDSIYFFRFQSNLIVYILDKNNFESNLAATEIRFRSTSLYPIYWHKKCETCGITHHINIREGSFLIPLSR